jgi:hypothetical protein
MNLINPIDDNYEGVTYQECIDKLIYAAIHLKQWVVAEKYIRNKLYELGEREIEIDWVDDIELSNAIDSFAKEFKEEGSVKAIYE